MKGNTSYQCVVKSTSVCAKSAGPGAQIDVFDPDRFSIHSAQAHLH